MAAETQGLHTGLRLAQRYQLVTRLARGALASVYQAQDLVLRRPVAIKVVGREYIESYQTAFGASSTLSHPAAVCVYDVIEQDGWLFIVQELVTAKPLSLYFRQGVPVERGVDLGRQLASALAYAHVHDVIHGDLTPSAVLVDRTAAVRINNFGLPPDREYFQRIATQLGASLGADDPTVETAAPSNAHVVVQPQAVSRQELATRADDTRAVGYLLWQLFTEAVPSLGADPTDGVRRFRAEVPQPLRDLVIDAAVQMDGRPILEPHALALELERLSAELARGRLVHAAAMPPAIQAARAAAQEAPWAAEETMQSGRKDWGGAPRDAFSPAREDEQLVHQAAAARASALVDHTAPPTLPPPRRRDAPAAVQAPIWDSREDRTEAVEPRGGAIPLIGVLLLGTVLFVLFFLVGYFSTMLR